jgi:hypothetical protein
VLLGNSNNPYTAQQALVTAQTSHVDHTPYAIPNALEAATVILSHYVRSGERLYATTDHSSTWNWTQCQDLVAYTGGNYPVVGGLLRGSYVSSHFSLHPGYNAYGVASLQKF